MKVSEIPYKRPDLDETLKTIDQAVAIIADAKSADDLFRARDIIVQMNKELATMGSLASMRFTINTKDPFYLEERGFYDEAAPVINVKLLEYYKAFLSSPFAADAKKSLNPLVFKTMEVALKASDERVLNEMQEENALITEFSKFVSEQLFDFRGEKLTLGILRKYMSDSDRNVRKDAYNALGATLKKNSEIIDGIFDKMVNVRDKMAKKLGYKNFIELGYYRMNRISYDEKMVAVFRNNVLKDIVPAVTALKAEVAKKLGIDQMKLFDNESYFKEDVTPILDAEGILNAGRQMYNEMSPATASFIEMMIENDAFDVLPRDGKWTGGYCTEFPLYNQPFIFANFNGTTGDVDVITHEAGHAFAFYAHQPYELNELNVGGMETAETHSMSMEFLCWKYMDKFFGKRAKDYCYKHLADSLTFIPYGVIVDYFQHLIYEKPEMTPAERKAVWKKLEEEFRPYMNADGIDYLEEGTRWQYQNHIFELPFYYIDYCLAQSVAIQFLALAEKNHDAAFQTYYEHVKRGGLYDFGTLVKMAGLKSPFEDGALKEVAAYAVNKLKELSK